MLRNPFPCERTVSRGRKAASDNSDILFPSRNTSVSGEIPEIESQPESVILFSSNPSPLARKVKTFLVFKKHLHYCDNAAKDNKHEIMHMDDIIGHFAKSIIRFETSACFVKTALSPTIMHILIAL